MFDIILLNATEKENSHDRCRTLSLFTTANWSRRTVLTLKKMLRNKGIAVDERTFFAKAADVETKTAEAKAFGEEISR